MTQNAFLRIKGELMSVLDAASPEPCIKFDGEQEHDLMPITCVYY
jgi:hypothetical protein